MGIKVNVKNFSRSETIESQTEQQPTEQTIEPEQEPQTDNEIMSYDEINYNDSNFLCELNKTNYNESIQQEKEKEDNIKLTKENLKQQEKIRKQQDKENLRIMKEQEKIFKEQEKEQQKVTQTKTKKNIDDNNSLFSETGHIVLGKEKNLLLKKVRQYKSLFPNELKKFKIKPNASEQELKNYIDEMQIITELDSVDDFLTDSILSSIKVEVPKTLWYKGLYYIVV